MLRNMSHKDRGITVLAHIGSLAIGAGICLIGFYLLS